MFVYDRAEGDRQIVVYAENFGDQIDVDQRNLMLVGKVRKGVAALSGLGGGGGLTDLLARACGQHALIQAAFSLMKVPDDVAIEVHLYSDAPAGASIGTSASVSVCLIGTWTCSRGRLTPYEIARTAQRIETEVLGLQCGIQDQLCAAYGGANLIEMASYPHASVSPLHVPSDVLCELERRLALVYLGSAHVSSDVHRRVIAHFEANGAVDDERLEGLRAEARRAKDAFMTGDFRALAAAMVANTVWQERLHPDLLGQRARKVIQLAQQCGALGWKLNGAGGEGGSVTLLFGDENTQRREFMRALKRELPEVSTPRRRAGGARSRRRVTSAAALDAGALAPDRIQPLRPARLGVHRGA